MRLYHGSTIMVDKPLTNIGRQDLDFGPGFYLTKMQEQAEKWARIKSVRHKDALPVLNIYELGDSFWQESEYKAKIFHKYDKDWLDFVAASRQGKRPWEGLDFVEGGIANDNVIATVDLYVDGILTVEQALDRLVNEELRHQICILNQEIIDKYLVFVNSETL